MIKNTGVVYPNDGKIVLDLDNRNGHWLDKAGSNKWSGVHIKKDSHDLDHWLHHLADQALSEKSKKIMDNFTIDDDIVCDLVFTL